jgi:hypothetical protein
LHDGFDRAATHVAIPQMWAFGVVILQPDIEVGLQFVQAGVELARERQPEELLLGGANEPLHEPVGLGRAHTGPAMVDVIQFEIDFIAPTGLEPVFLP